MARYDAGWGGSQWGRYDQLFQTGRGGGGANRGRFGMRGRGGYDEGFRGGEGGWGQGGSWGGGGSGTAYGQEMEEDRSGMYGPARYGLGPYHERLRTRRRADEEIKEEVEEALFYDTWVDAEAITVEVKEGIVTLRGSLPSFEEVRYATDDAWDVDGVRGVRSELEVREQER